MTSSLLELNHPRHFLTLSNDGGGSGETQPSSLHHPPLLRPPVFPLRSPSRLALHPMQPPDNSPLFSPDDDPFAVCSPATSETTSSRARPPKPAYTPALPPAAQWLLLSTEPPPALSRHIAHTSLQVAQVEANSKRLVGKLKKLGRMAPRVANLPGDVQEKSTGCIAVYGTRKLDGDTHADELPRTWDEYTALYARVRLPFALSALPAKGLTRSRKTSG